MKIKWCKQCMPHNSKIFFFCWAVIILKIITIKIQNTRFSKDQPDSRRLEWWLTPWLNSTRGTRAPASPGQVKPTAPTATNGPTGAQPAQPTDHIRALSKLPKGTCWTGQCLCSTRTSRLSCCWFELFWEGCVWCYNHDQFSYLKSHLSHGISAKAWESYIQISF